MLTLRQQIAQMLIMGFDGTEINDQNPVKNWLEKEGLGGVLLFDYDLAAQGPGKNIRDASQVKALIQQLHHCALSSDAGSEFPLFVAVDYEGGAVDRLRHLADIPTSLSPKQYASLPPEQQQQEAQKMADTLTSLGFNLNFAPLLDLNLNERQGIIGKLARSYGTDAAQVAAIAKQFVTVLADQGITCCYKHFPGHGSALGDTHEGFVDVTETFIKDELQPYAELLPHNTLPVMVMTAHVINRQLDPDGLPATLSSRILTGLLRDQIGFDGVIISDDLQMHAISQHYSLADSLRLTINAGADMVIFANQLGRVSATEVIDVIEGLVQRGLVAANRIQQACERIRKLKQKQGASIAARPVRESTVT
ncbi:glycoside hydrolase family 3 N-terminal domain-containing protein [Legionella taurinensis]|uniref:beta-N-acetylhexosaminidase n=1 Tax=Legionella taurinensis TaxID=70611 RepID=A0A3A5L9P7_9GAMM|nr:glycoside hydrolase family 3 N-terminal domain-containing protein [Legionella taurinensis]RJT43675.1 glycoside hydrolase family 3 protein [Legionella taurinensis]RJT64762.1 glycoside hydrolase family 3 protein [Legionella taurinensis]STY26597.1 beta-N-acetylhexosaminidase [Legionella taurinensis]